jgi:hypothetical protein
MIWLSAHLSARPEDADCRSHNLGSSADIAAESTLLSVGYSWTAPRSSQLTVKLARIGWRVAGVAAPTTWFRRKFAGAPGGNRTPDPLLRRQLLYPTELPGRGSKISRPKRFWVSLTASVAEVRFGTLAVGVAQSVRAPGCGLGGRGFDPPRPPHKGLVSLGIRNLQGGTHAAAHRFTIRAAP